MRQFCWACGGRAVFSLHHMTCRSLGRRRALGCTARRTRCLAIAWPSDGITISSSQRHPRQTLRLVLQCHCVHAPASMTSLTSTGAPRPSLPIPTGKRIGGPGSSGMVLDLVGATMPVESNRKPESPTAAAPATTPTKSHQTSFSASLRERPPSPSQTTPRPPPHQRQRQQQH